MPALLIIILEYSSQPDELVTKRKTDHRLQELGTQKISMGNKHSLKTKQTYITMKLDMPNVHRSSLLFRFIYQVFLKLSFQ